MDETTTPRELAVVAVEDNEDMPANKRARTGTESVGQNEDSAQSTRTSRGRTHLDKLTAQTEQGLKNIVQFDSKGRPIGKAAAQLQSYVGVLARENVNITYDNWKKVPYDVKENIWKTVNVSLKSLQMVYL